MHSKQAAFFVPRLLFFSFFLPYPPSASPFLPSETSGLRHHRPPLTPLFGRQSPPLSLSLSLPSFSLFPSLLTSPREKKAVAMVEN